MTTTQLFDQLATAGGAVVSSAACSPMEIAVAQSCGRFAIDENNLGYVRRPKEWLAAQGHWAARAEELHAALKALMTAACDPDDAGEVEIKALDAAWKQAREAMKKAEATA